MNGHRTAVVALLTAARAERDHHRTGAGPTHDRLADRIAALESVLVAGDEAEEGDDDIEWNESIREAVEARIEIGALRRSLARALGRRMTTRPLLGIEPEREVAPPADDVMLSEVDGLLRKGREFEALRTELRETLGLPRVATGERVLAVLRERMTNAEAADRHCAEAETRAANLERRHDRDRLVEALRVLVDAAPDAWPTDSDVVSGVWAYMTVEIDDQRRDAALALLADTPRED